MLAAVKRSAHEVRNYPRGREREYQQDIFDVVGMIDQVSGARLV
jgi:hypothetical protein